jgi:hypothetical protein
MDWRLMIDDFGFLNEEEDIACGERGSSLTPDP